MRANAVNLATFINALCHLNATPLSVAVLAPCAWGENLACGSAWQGVVNSATHNTAWRGEFDNEMAKRGKIQWHGNKIRCNEFSVASICGQNNARQIRLGKCGEMVFAGKTKRGDTTNSVRRKWGGVWAGDFSLSLSLSLSLARAF